ncbi:Flavin-containing monooxygenase FMO GS-OX-like 8 [Zea mays]|uniref:Flavin-containing monooxygenase n=1 Tax=Zea mays TaxID=4577 RepID=A0A3L6DXP6_MAIZE|nr:Flavin-containing monooxygenase FMO GS-OX-like 8 [Zea mays]
MASSSKKVCVVGAGVSGLVSARELRREGHDVTVMEQSGGIGGQWLYDPRTDADDALGAHSSIYASLRLNTPRESTGFSDFPFAYPSNDDGAGDGRRYPGHAEYLRYIRRFCDAFGLMDAVRLNTKVLHVAPFAPRGHGDGVTRWTVRCSSRLGDCQDDAVTTEETFDAVVVAVGQFTQPRLPAINGMDKWSRRQLHSRSYRVPDSFENQVVVVVGCQASGVDIALELRTVARDVHVSVKSVEDDVAVSPGMRKAVSRHHNLHLHIDSLCEDGQVVFADGSSVVADAIVYCTGYVYSFPFLDTGGLVTVDDSCVGPLFEHTFPPALSFVGVPKKVVVPRFFEAQARWVAQVLSGRRSLPPEAEMLRSAEENNRARGKHLAHDILDDYDYCDDFGEKHCGFPRLEGWKKELRWSSLARRHDSTESFRDVYHDDSNLIREGFQA